MKKGQLYNTPSILLSLKKGNCISQETKKKLVKNEALTKMKGSLQ